MDISTMIKSESHSALIKLFKHLYANTRDAVIEMRLIDQETKKAHRQFFYADAWEEAMKFGVSVEGFNVFLGMALRQDETSGAKANCSRLNVLWCDVDDPSQLMAGAWPEKLPKPSQVWASGGTVGDLPKMHFYWLLNEPLAPADFDDAEAVMRAMATILNGDSNCTDVARALRMPGTLNYKYPIPVRNECIIQDDVTHNFNDLSPLMEFDPMLIQKQVWAKRQEERAKQRKFYAERRITGQYDDKEPLTLLDPIGVMCEHCSLMDECQATSGDLPEPLWFAALSNLAAFDNYGADPHSFSNGHTKYNFNETERKYRKAVENVDRYGPVGCGAIAANGGCGGCAYNGTIKSPAGIPYKVAVEEMQKRKKEEREEKRKMTAHKKQMSARERISVAAQVATDHSGTEKEVVRQIVIDPGNLLHKPQLPTGNDDF